MQILLQASWLKKTWSPNDGAATGTEISPEPTAAGTGLTPPDDALDALSDEGGEGNDDELLKAFEGVDSLPDAEPTSAPAVVTSAPAVTSAAAQPTTSAAVSQAPAVSSAAPAVSEAPGVTSQAPAVSESTAPTVDPVQVFTSWRSSAIETLAAHHYQLTDDEADAILTNPKEALPKMAARVYLDAVTAATNVLARNMPSIIDQHLARARAVDEMEAKFYDQWPGLKSHAADVVAHAVAYRKAHPTLEDADKFIRDVGAIVSVALNIPPDQARAKVAAAAAPSASPALQTLAPHRPPASGARQVGGPAAATPPNPFEQMALEE